MPVEEPNKPTKSLWSLALGPASSDVTTFDPSALGCVRLGHETELCVVPRPRKPPQNTATNATVAPSSHGGPGGVDEADLLKPKDWGPPHRLRLQAVLPALDNTSQQQRVLASGKTAHSGNVGGGAGLVLVSEVAFAAMLTAVGSLRRLKGGDESGSDSECIEVLATLSSSSLSSSSSMGATSAESNLNSTTGPLGGAGGATSATAAPAGPQIVVVRVRASTSVLPGHLIASSDALRALRLASYVSEIDQVEVDQLAAASTTDASGTTDASASIERRSIFHGNINDASWSSMPSLAVGTRLTITAFRGPSFQAAAVQRLHLRPVMLPSTINVGGSTHPPTMSPPPLTARAPSSRPPASIPGGEALVEVRKAFGAYLTTALTVPSDRRVSVTPVVLSHGGLLRLQGGNTIAEYVVNLELPPRFSPSSNNSSSSDSHSKPPPPPFLVLSPPCGAAVARLLDACALHPGRPMEDWSTASVGNDSNSSNIAMISSDVSDGSKISHDGSSSSGTNSSLHDSNLACWDLNTFNGLGAFSAASLAENALEPTFFQMNPSKSNSNLSLEASAVNNNTKESADVSTNKSHDVAKESVRDSSEDDDEDEDELEDDSTESNNDDPLMASLLEFVGPAVLAPLVLDRAITNGNTHAAGGCGALTAPFVLLYGDSGVGKSTLVASLARRLGSPPSSHLLSQYQQHQQKEERHHHHHHHHHQQQQPLQQSKQHQDVPYRPVFPAVACEWVSCSDLIGATMPHVLDVLERACQNAALRAPCLLVFDDLDLLVPDDSSKSSLYLKGTIFLVSCCLPFDDDTFFFILRS